MASRGMKYNPYGNRAQADLANARQQMFSSAQPNYTKPVAAPAAQPVYQAPPSQEAPIQSAAQAAQARLASRMQGPSQGQLKAVSPFAMARSARQLKGAAPAQRRGLDRAQPFQQARARYQGAMQGGKRLANAYQQQAGALQQNSQRMGYQGNSARRSPFANGGADTWRRNNRSGGWGG